MDHTHTHFPIFFTLFSYTYFPVVNTGTHCRYFPGILLFYLFRVAEPNPPVDLMITVEGLILVAVWRKPFSLKGEHLSYPMNTANGVKEEGTVSSTKYALSVNEPVGERDSCTNVM